MANPKAGDVVVNLGQCPAEPLQSGTTTNSKGVVFPTYKFMAGLSSNNIPLSAGKEYVMAFVFNGEATNGTIRLSLSSTNGTPDLYGSGNTAAGPTTSVGFTRPQFATALYLQALATPVALTITNVAGGVEIAWPNVPHQGLYSITDLNQASNPSAWQLVSGSTGTNKVFVPFDGSPQKFFRLKQD